MARETRMTTDHQVIRKWVDRRGGWPAIVKKEQDEGEADILYLNFSGCPDQPSLEAK